MVETWGVPRQAYFGHHCSGRNYPSGWRISWIKFSMELANRVIFEIKGEKGMDVHDLLHNEWRYLQMELQDGPATLFYPLQYVHVCLSRPDEQQTSTNRFFFWPPSWTLMIGGVIVPATRRLSCYPSFPSTANRSPAAGTMTIGSWTYL